MDCGESNIEKVPAHLRQEFKFAQSASNPTDPRGGIRFVGQRDNIRVMQGDPTAKFLHQKQDYVKITSNGRSIGRDGLAISDKIFEAPSEIPEAHIPLNEWIKWEKWNKK